jgi:hypothetical protein
VVMAGFAYGKPLLYQYTGSILVAYGPNPVTLQNPDFSATCLGP